MRSALQGVHPDGVRVVPLKLTRIYGYSDVICYEILATLDQGRARFLPLVGESEQPCILDVETNPNELSRCLQQTQTKEGIWTERRGIARGYFSLCGQMERYIAD